MHPNKAFDWSDPADMLDLSRSEVLPIFSRLGRRPVRGAVPLLADREQGRFAFTSAPQSNGAHIDGPLLISLAGRDAYQSANWYASDDQGSHPAL